MRLCDSSFHYLSINTHTNGQEHSAQRVVVRCFSREWQCRRQAGGVAVASLRTYIYQLASENCYTYTHSFNLGPWKCSPINLHTCGDGTFQQVTPNAASRLWQLHYSDLMCKVTTASVQVPLTCT